MVEFFTTLGAVVVLAVGAFVPGLVAGHAERALADRFPGATPHVKVEADPFLELPRGHVSRLTVDLDGAELGPLVVPDLTLEARDLRVPAGSLWGFGKPTLLAPAPVAVRFGGSPDAWRASLAKAIAGGKLDDVPLPKNPVGTAIGGAAGAGTMELTFAPGRLGAVMRAPGKAGEVLHVTFSFAPAISADGKQLLMSEPRVKIGEKELPPMLLRLAGAQPLVDLSAQRLPGRDWRFERFAVGPDGLWAELGGVLDALPAE